jgi:hypothetical protein
MYLKLRTLLLPFFVMVFSVFATVVQAQTATVTNDKPDYAPRSTAVFTGSGFQPNEDVVLKVKNLFRACNTVTADSSYLPWTVTADANGDFITNWIVCDCVGDSLRLKATGQNSGLIAYAYFSDAIATTLTLDQASYSVNKNSSLTVTATLKNSSNAAISGAVSSLFTFTLSDGTTTLTPSALTPNSTGSDGRISATFNNVNLLVGGPYFKNNGPDGVVVRFAGSGSGASALQKSDVVAPLTVNTIPTTISAVSGSGVYGGTGGLTATISPIVNGVPVAFLINGRSVGSANTDASGVATLSGVSLRDNSSGSWKYLDAGTYTTSTTIKGITASVDASANTTAASGAGNLVVDKRLITITGNANQSKVYGSDNPPYAYTITSGTLAPGVAGLTPSPISADQISGALGREAGENAAGGSGTNGVYPYERGAITIKNGTTDVYSNYTVTYQGTFAITKANATFNIVGHTGVYDGDPHAASGTAEGVKGEDLSSLLSFGAGIINVPGGSASWSFAGNGNYNSDGGTRAIVLSKRLITITADAKSKYCGQTEPYLSYQISSGTLAPGDNFTGSLTRVAGTGAGTYAIQQGTVALSTNYTLSYVGANLTINGIAIDASASGNPVPTGSPATLYATVTPAVAGITVIFKLDGVQKGTGVTQIVDGKAIATLSVTGLVVNVYQVEATTGAGCGSSTAYLPVYDPNSGFVTGGGWINSPAGAYVPDPTATGKANMGFVAKYAKGTAMAGETEFNFQTGNMKFNSTSYEAATLVISGFKASYRGVGTINGTGSYKFTLVAIDGDITGGGGSDKIRMKIVNASTGAVVYDNQIGAADNADPGMALAGGSIVIHEVKKTTSNQAITVNTIVQEEADAKFGLTVFPNPSRSQFNIHLQSNNTTDKITLNMIDVSGRSIQVLTNLYAGQTIQIGDNYRPGIYFVEMMQGKNHKQVKLLKVIY